MEKPSIKICGSCQKEFPEIDAQVKAHKEEINFSHGSCLRHMIEYYNGMSKYVAPEKLNTLISNAHARKDEWLPDLAEHPELVKAYSQGIFDPNVVALKERLQKLANIIRS